MCDEISVLWWCVQQEVVMEHMVMLMMVLLLARLWQIVSMKGACFNARMGAKGFGEASGG